MRKFIIGIGITALTLLLLASALAFSLTLQNLRLSALSFVQPAAAVLIAAPMTSTDEAAIASPDTNSVRLEEFVPPSHACNKDKFLDRATDF